MARFEKLSASIVNLKSDFGLQRFSQLQLKRRCRLCETSAPAVGNICEDCIAALPAPPPLCPRCAEKLASESASCMACAEQTPAFERSYVAWQWAAPLSGLIKQFKFDGRRDIGNDLAKVFAAQVENGSFDIRPDALLAMPLHSSRLKERGFNQAAILTGAISKALKLPIINAERTRATDAQSGLKRQQRLKNLEGAFAATAEVKDLNILIVDDVMTTGSSAQMLSLALLDAGAASVQVLVVCKVI